jgi:hypothetical protein
MKNDKALTHVTSLFQHFKLILDNEVVVSYNQKPSYMTESNMCLSFEFNFSAKENVTRESLKSLIEKNYMNEYEIFQLNENNHELYISNDKVNDFRDSKIEASLTSLSLLNKNIKTIQFIGSFPLAVNDDIFVDLTFFDSNNKIISYNADWIIAFKTAYKKYFNANSVGNIKMGMIIRLLIGDNPNIELEKSINNTIFITTEYKDDFDCTETNKSFANSKLSLD